MRVILFLGGLGCCVTARYLRSDGGVFLAVTGAATCFVLWTILALESWQSERKRRWSDGNDADGSGGPTPA